MNESVCESELITKDYILSLINERDLLLICLNKILTNDLTKSVELSTYITDLLLEIHCTHSDSYVKYICGKVIIKCVTEDKLDINCLLRFQCWHCFPHLSKLLSDLLHESSKEKCDAIHTNLNYILLKLSQLCEPNYIFCQKHCLCYTIELFDGIYSEINDQNLNQIVLNLIKLFDNRQKRCFDNKFLNLLNSIVKECENNSITIKSISEWIFDQNFLSDGINICNTLYGFGGKYSSDNNEHNDEYECDVIILRKLTLLYLNTLSSPLIMRSTSNDIINTRLQNISDLVRNKCNKMSGNDCFIELFIEEDVQLLNALYSIIKLNDNQLSHLLMSKFIEAIHSDNSVLLDMLCNDDETATNLLQLLLIYLKLTDITTNIAINVRNVLLELCDKIERLTSKKLFPYNVKPLIRLLNKLRI